MLFPSLYLRYRGSMAVLALSVGLGACALEEEPVPVVEDAAP